MDIYIDIHRAIGADGKAIMYAPEVHWKIDDQDTITPDGMRLIQEKIQNNIEELLKAGRIRQ